MIAHLFLAVGQNVILPKSNLVNTVARVSENCQIAYKTTKSMPARSICLMLGFSNTSSGIKSLCAYLNVGLNEQGMLKYGKDS